MRLKVRLFIHSALSAHFGYWHMAIDQLFIVQAATVSLKIISGKII